MPNPQGSVQGRSSERRHLRAAAVVVLAALLGTSVVGNAALADATDTSAATRNSPSTYGQPAYFTAAVGARVGGSGEPTGTVTFRDGATTIGSAALDAVGIGQLIGAGASHSCAVTALGTVQCWGANSFGQIGDGTTLPTTIPISVSGMVGTTVTAIAVGDNHACALTSAGGVKCWGSNAFGQLGNGTTANSSTPVDVTGLGSGVTAIAAGEGHSCAITGTTGVKCWGNNASGQLGNGSTTSSSTPVDVTGLSTGASAIAAGGSHSCAVIGGGAVTCWGLNADGQLGDGTNTNATSPVGVSGLAAGAVSVAAGGGHTCVVTSTAGASCWGRNGNGQLGDGSVTSSNIPLDVTGLSADVTAVTAGRSHTCALWTAGAAMCWGANTRGQLGDLTHTQRTSPVQVNGFDTDIAVIAGGGEHTCSVRITGQVECWGYNTSGQVGDGTKTGVPEPKAVAGLSPKIATAVFSTSALPGGSRSITATYDGDATHTTSTSGVVTHVVSRAAATASVVDDVDPTVFGQSVTFTATVTPSAGGPATGTVTFKEGAATLGTASLAGGTASLPLSNLTVGLHTIFVIYGGDGNFNSATSASIGHRVKKAPTTTTLGSAPNPSRPGAAVTFTATVTSDTGTPTGRVNLKEGTRLLGSGNLVSGVATIVTSALTSGSHDIVAVYAGSAEFNTSTSAALGQIVEPRLGAEARVNAFVTGAQLRPATATLSDGGFVLLWQSVGQDGSAEGVFGRRYTAAGVKTGSEFRANRTTVDSQSLPAVAGLVGGGFVAAWQSAGQDGAGKGVYAQRFTAAGLKTGTEFRVNSTTSGSQGRPSIAALNGGGFVVVWESTTGDGSGRGIFGRSYDALGVPLGSEYSVNVTKTGDQGDPSIAALASGGFVVVWRSVGQDGDLGGVYGQRFAANSLPVGSEFQVNTTTLGDQSEPAVVGLTAGGFVVTWTSANQDGSGLGVIGQRFTASAGKAGPELIVTTEVANNQWQPAIAAFPAGGFVIVWASSLQDGSGHGVYAQRFDAVGAKVDVEVRVNTFVLKDQWQPAISVQSSSMFTVAWTSRDQDGSLEGIYLQRFELGTAP